MRMNYPQLIMGFILIIAGLGTYFIASKMGPNHWFGVRYSYTMLNREIWEKTNRLGGLLFLGAGIFLELAALVMPKQWEPLFVILGVGLVLLTILLTYYYAKGLAQGESPEEQALTTPDQGRLKKLYLAFALALNLILLMVSIWYYPNLPEQMATHFLTDGQPDGWVNKPLALAFPIIIQSFLIFIFYLTYGEQERSYHWQAKKRGFPFQVQLGVFFSIHLVVTFASLDVITYNLLQEHLLQMHWVLFIVTTLVIFPPLFFYWRYRKKEPFQGI